MKSNKIFFLALGVCLILGLLGEVKAQFMPTVYDHVYGKDVRFTRLCADFPNGDVVTIGENGGRVMVSWFDRQGECLLSRTFNPDEFTGILNVLPLKDGKVLLTGVRSSSDRTGDAPGGQMLVLSRQGQISHDISFGRPGTRVTGGRMLASGGFVICGDTPVDDGGRSGFVCKVSADNRLVYTYIATAGETCTGIDVLGGHTEYLHAAFSAGEKEGASVVRLDENGKPFFITQLPDRTFHIEKMISTNEGKIYIVGEGEKTGGAVIKIREEGDIVFQKQIIPVTSATKLDQLIVCPTGEVLVGGNDLNNSYYALLRSDGTELTSSIDKGVIAGMTHNPLNGDCVVSLYEPITEKGKIVKLSRQGRHLYEKATATDYTELRINSSGDLLMASAMSGRLSMLSGLGELQFDRYVTEGAPAHFLAVSLPANGEAVFLGEGARIAKLAHGVFLSDIQIMKPIAGTTTAVFTVSLSGYSYSEEGAPLPVTVNYKTRPITASEGVNFDPVAGTLSFIPATDGSDRYVSKFTVEVPVNANDLLEGDRVFALDLSDVKNSYMIRNSSKATIIDQPALVQLIGTKPGLEGESDIIYELGIFKTNGKALTNSTKSNIIVDGVYGKSTADGLDFEIGRLPRLIIEPGKHSGTFNVVTREDTRYESVKNVVIDFNKIYAMSDVDLSFGSTQLSCAGLLYDQPAMVAIEALGDYGRKNNVISGFCKISLLRAKDGALQTNNSGGDVVLTVAVDSSSTAVLGKDFVLTNIYDLRILPDGNSSAVNLSGVVLYSLETDPRSVMVNLEGVQGVKDAGKITVSPDKSKARFMIKGNN